MTCDAAGRFVLADFSQQRPFSSFLPGIAGPLGIPLWAFYVNRGQALASFGVGSKDHPIVEFQPANKAYQAVPYLGFRTFIRTSAGGDPAFYEPFGSQPRQPGSTQWMAIGANELELQEASPRDGLQVNVLYFILPGERFAALVRQVTLTNVTGRALAVELLDGLPAVIPYGVNDRALKDMGRTLEAWMEVVGHTRGIPFYRVRASVTDTAEVEAVRAGFFYLAFCAETGEPLQFVVDPAVVFGSNTALSRPDRFVDASLADLLERPQVTSGRTPCGFCGIARSLAPSQSLTIAAIIGHAHDLAAVHAAQPRLARADYVRAKRQEAQALVADLTAKVTTRTGFPLFDAYCRQSLLDNVLRGGWPMLLGSAARPRVYHIYSRKHGDLERDYNAFYTAPEFYSHGDVNYRDVNQNRRADVWLEPRVEDFDVVTFMSLMQADGYNPLVIHGSHFAIPADRLGPVLESAEDRDELARLLTHPFTPGQLLTTIADRAIRLRVPPAELLERALDAAEHEFAATFETGYWIDHWTYNLDLIEAYLEIYPDRQAELLHGRSDYTFYDSSVTVRPRSEKHVLAGGRPRQWDAVADDAEKAALIAARPEHAHAMRLRHGLGEICRVTLFVKLVCLAAVKFATLDPGGMGIEMEAGRPGWYDALNGLPGLFGSSMPETFELHRLLAFLLQAIPQAPGPSVALPTEVFALLQTVHARLREYHASTSPDREFAYWDAVATAREEYRASIRLGFDGRFEDLGIDKLGAMLGAFLEKVRAGIDRALALNAGIPPTYLVYEAAEYDILAGEPGDARRGAEARPHIRARRFTPRALPLFLEGPVRFLRIQTDRAAARQLYERVKASDLFDRKLKMYKVNASLEAEPHDIGRARAFTPGWLENESIWLHMEYKYLLEVLRAGLFAEFYEDFRSVLIPFLDPAVYGRSPLENSSFLVSSAHPDESLHGGGFVARLSGATAEFLSIWHRMMAGGRPFQMRDGQLCLALAPALPGWLFDDAGTVTFTFLGTCNVVYHNPLRRDTFGHGAPTPARATVELDDGRTVELAGGLIGPPYAELVRAGRAKVIHLYLTG